MAIEGGGWVGGGGGGGLVTMGGGWVGGGGGWVGGGGGLVNVGGGWVKGGGLATRGGGWANEGGGCTFSGKGHKVNFNKLLRQQNIPCCGFIATWGTAVGGWDGASVASFLSGDGWDVKAVVGALLGIGGGPLPTGFLDNWGLATGEGVPELAAAVACSAVGLVSSARTWRLLTGSSFTSAVTCGTGGPLEADSAETGSGVGSFLTREATAGGATA